MTPADHPPADHLDDDPALFAASMPPAHAKTARLRPPRFAGRLYPEDAGEMRRAVQLSKPTSSERLTGLVLPHGPWSHVARLLRAALAEGVLEETVVVLGPNHLGRGPRAAIVCDGAYAMPGAASIPIDGGLAESIRALGGLAEAPEVLAADHAIEILLPFLSAAQPRLQLVPIAMHDTAPSTAARIGDAVADAIVSRGGGATLIATTNLAHYVAASELAAVSDPIALAAASLDAPALLESWESRVTRRGPIVETCGLGALLTFVHAMRALGVTSGRVIGRGTSFDVEGNDGGGVAYAAISYR